MVGDLGRIGSADRAGHEPSPKGLGHSVTIPCAWQPIETAPLEERVLLWCADEYSEWREPRRPKGVVFGRVVDYGEGDRKCFGDGMSGDWTFTHWMPVPGAPTPDRSGDADKTENAGLAEGESGLPEGSSD